MKLGDKKIKQKTPNIKDVALKATVSPKTVSNYLNKSAPVSKEKVKKIKEAIKELGYTPNIFARGLRIGKSRIIGVLLPEFANPYYAPIVDGIEYVASENDYSIIFERNNNDNNKLNSDLDKFSNYVDGIIICTSMVEGSKISNIIERGIPIVTLDTKIENGMFPSVEVNNYKAAYDGTNYLLSLGHRNIYYISEPLFLDTTKDRLKGYIDCLKENNIKIDNSKIYIDDRLKIEKAKIGEEIMKEIIRNISIPAAIFGTSDLIIIGAMKVATEKKYYIPDDISFLGFDNIYWCDYANPPLSTIKQPKKEMGMISMKLLIDLLSKKKVKEKRIILKTSLIKRKSIKNLCG